MAELNPETGLFIDLVQIRCPGAGSAPSSFGSGLLVGHGLVLTALHCVSIKEQAWRDRDTIRVYLWRDLTNGNLNPYKGRLVWPPAPRKNPADIAVLVIENSDLPQPQPQPQARWVYTELPKGSFPVEVRGFPRISASDSVLGDREELNLSGTAFLKSTSGTGGPTLLFSAAAAAEKAGTQVWAGLSGGPVIHQGGAVLAVMRDVPEGWNGSETLSAAVLAPLLRSAGANAELRGLLSVSGDLPQPNRRGSMKAKRKGKFQDFERERALRLGNNQSN